MQVSVVVPCYNEFQNINEYYLQTSKILKQLPCDDYEFLFVDDGSSDDTLDLLKQLAQKDDHVRYISFSRNFGKEAAMIAGLEHSKGDYTAVMDVDLQDVPDMLLQMYDILSKGEYDCVAARRSTREGEPVIRSFFAKIFYKVVNLISKTPVVDGARDFRLMTRQMVDSIVSMPEYNRFSKGIFQWVGFKTYWLPYENVERHAGNTKWSFWGLVFYALDGIMDFSAVPLAMSSILGIIISIVAFLFGIYFIFQKLYYGINIPGYAAMIVIICMLSGVQLLSTGVLGQYLAKIYLEVKRRPKYIIAEGNIRKE